MSTRSNILIQYGSTKIYLYRHCDGYPAINGVDLADAIGKAKSPGALVADLLSRRYEKQSYETEARPIYELTTDFHGDIEWAYVVYYPRDGYATNNKPTTIGVSDMEFRRDMDEATRERRLASLPATQSDFSLEDFTAYVQREEQKMEEWQAAYFAAHPEVAKLYGVNV